MMRALHVCAELYPLLKTGGLADVTGALPPALALLGCDARVLVPGFPALSNGVQDQQLVADLSGYWGADPVRLYRGLVPGSRTVAYVIDAPQFYDRHGNPYSDSANRAYLDNDRRFALLGQVAAWLAEHGDSGWRPQVVHGHDWHAGLAMAYLKAREHQSGRRLAGTVYTVHNLAYQGVFDAGSFHALGLPDYFFNLYGMEYHGQVSFMKAGLYYADQITTVSPTYAREIQQPEQGCGLDGLLASRSHELHGILNGVDPAIWNPVTDSLLATNYDATDLSGKHACKRALQAEFGLAERDGALLFCVVSRLTEQKGLQLVLAGLPALVERGGQLALLGSGEPAMEEAFLEAARQHPAAVAVRIGYDEALSHRLIAGADAILVPSRYEPCGLTQLYGLAYGTLPLVHRVGGLADSVVDCSLENLAEDRATGFTFDGFELAGYDAAMRRAFALAERPADLAQVQRCAMRQQFSWDVAARQYLALYEQVAV
ncbi:MAG: glycogen synthase GlgA [Noviherbaspirillum sp.]